MPSTQEVIYKPPFWSVIKFAWVQYFCALIFWYYVLYEWFFGALVRRFVFDAHVVTNFNLAKLSAR